jgi:hypothetical protein
MAFGGGDFHERNRVAASLRAHKRREGGATMCAVAGAFNYFHYFTEIEEYFWKKRGANLLVSPLDWAIMESWQQAGIPLPAVLKGIDRAFESYARSRRGRSGQPLKSLAYCVDAVMEAAEQHREAAAGAGPQAEAPPPAQETFSPAALLAYLRRNAEKLEAAARRSEGAQAAMAARLRETRARLEELAPIVEAPGRLDVEDLERRLTVLEEKLLAAMKAEASENVLLDLRREFDRQVAAHRGRMSGEQLAQLEQRFVARRLLEIFSVPRLSLFYIS